MKKTAAIYVRVSTPDQHVESQLYDLRELAVQRGLEVVHEYEDRGFCGKKARRLGLDRLMADAQKVFGRAGGGIRPHCEEYSEFSTSDRRVGQYGN